MTVMLTDDEVAALAIDSSRAWPTPLPSLDLVPEVLAAARNRGIRSLVTRGLIQVVGDEGIADADIVRMVSQVTGSSRWMAAYVSASVDNVIEGTSTFVYDTGAEAILDLVSPTGIHTFTSTTWADATAVVSALATNVSRYGIRGDSGGAALLIGGNSSSSWVRVTFGKAESGAMDAVGAFEPSADVSDIAASVAALAAHT